MKVLITGGQGGIATGIKEMLVGYELYTPSHSDLDISNISSIESYFHTQNFDILINCAGYIKPEKITNLTYKSVISHFQVNIIGPFLLCQTFLNKGGKIIVNIGSTSALEGRPEWSCYCASKAAMLSLTESLVAEGHIAYAIHPSRTVSKMRERLFPDEDKSTLMDPKRIGKYVKWCIEGRYLNGTQLIVKKDKVQRVCGRGLIDLC